MAVVQDGKTYQIMNLGNSGVVDLYNGDPNPGAKVLGWEFYVKTYTISRHQIWRAHKVGTEPGLGDWFTFTNIDTPQRAIDSGGHGNEGKAVHTWIYDENNVSQNWALLKIGSANFPAYQLINKAQWVLQPQAKYALTLTNGNLKTGVDINNNIAENPGANLAQSWLFIQVDV